MTGPNAPKTDDIGSEGQIMPFATVLQQVAKGNAHEEASTELQRLVRAVAETGKKGTLTLTVTVGPLKGNEDALAVETKIVTKVPTEPRASVFFADEIGNLTRSDPRQIAADLTVVGTARRGETA